MNVIQLTPLRLPDITTLSAVTREKLASLEAIVSTYLLSSETSKGHDRVVGFPNEEINRLTHRLSAHYLTNQKDIKNDGRTLLETALINQFSDDYNRMIMRAKFDCFLAFLTFWSGKINPIKPGIRKTAMRTSSDKNGHYIRFIDAKHLVDGLRNIWAIIINAPFNNLYSAVISSTALLAYHPFYDGNGRFCRLLINAMLKRCYDNYIPLHDIYHLSQGGYFIRLRQALIFSEWDEIILFHYNIVSFFTPKPCKLS
ncbi:Fic family protein [Serratia ficaria]|uniref:Fic family protein n=1 Tax=Serratia ficaria TaxID=61651 RepID=UPI002177BDF3|nr:Fic family protein [Serratia ficaria]CAI1162663.1 Fic/DOC family [Serratia ficaria]CAI1169141.1 Fic/DOC family [Serratia ficaria]CAI1973821.1 Fic/DOC family [Serratia ficaria]CAI2526212.1 Fic/DOC family [Serratia ficaria]CAI2533377.1 Fic/DOC family [Serratia ficaria]